MLKSLLKKARRHRLRNPSVWTSAPVIALVVLASAFWAGSHLEEIRKRHREARAAEGFVAKVQGQIREVEALYQRPIHDLRFARRQVVRQVAAVVGELGLNRDVSRHPQASLSVGRLYSAVRQDRAAAHFFDQLWRSGERSTELARARAVVHGRMLIRRWIAPRRWIEPGPVAADEQANGGVSLDSWAAMEESFHVIAPEDPRTAQMLGQLRDVGAVAGTDAPALDEWLSALPELGPQLEAEGVDPAWLAGSLHLIQARLLMAGSDQDIERARPSWTAAIEAFNEAQMRRPSDSDVFLGLCAAWLDVLRADLRIRVSDDDTAPLSRAPLSRAPLSRAPLSRAPRFSQAEVSCQDGLRTAPESIPLLLGRSEVDLLHAEWRLERELDPSPWILDSRRLIERVLAQVPDQAEALADAAQADRLEKLQNP